MAGPIDEYFIKFADVLFNGRPADPAPKACKVTLERLIDRRVSHVMAGGKLYRIEVTEIEAGKLKP